MSHIKNIIMITLKVIGFTLSIAGVSLLGVDVVRFLSYMDGLGAFDNGMPIVTACYTFCVAGLVTLALTPVILGGKISVGSYLQKKGLYMMVAFYISGLVATLVYL
jgi:hypothetical protein